MQTEAQQEQYLHDLSVSARGGYLGCVDLAILSSELNVDIIVVLEAHPPNPASRNVVSSMHPSVRPSIVSVQQRAQVQHLRQTSNRPRYSVSLLDIRNVTR